MSRENLTYEERNKLDELKLIAESNQKSPKKAEKTNFDILSKWFTESLVDAGLEASVNVAMTIMKGYAR